MDVLATETIRAAESHDRRRVRQGSQSPLLSLQDMPSLLLLERLTVPVLAVDDRGAIVYANNAFAAIVGYRPQDLTTLNVTTLLPSVPLGESGVVSALRGRANSLVELRHAEGWTIPVLMSGSALSRHDDPLVLTTFADVSDQLWDTGDCPRSSAVFPGQTAAV
jgi:PAS domain S-box-containing protein